MTATLRTEQLVCIIKNVSASYVGECERWAGTSYFMPLLWLRVATVLYGVGLIHAILMLRQKGERSGRIAVPAVCLGIVFHLVSLVETALLYGLDDRSALIEGLKADINIVLPIHQHS